MDSKPDRHYESLRNKNNHHNNRNSTVDYRSSSSSKRYNHSNDDERKRNRHNHYDSHSSSPLREYNRSHNHRSYDNDNNRKVVSTKKKNTFLQDLAKEAKLKYGDNTTTIENKPSVDLLSSPLSLSPTEDKSLNQEENSLKKKKPLWMSDTDEDSNDSMEYEKKEEESKDDKINDYSSEPKEVSGTKSRSVSPYISVQSSPSHILMKSQSKSPLPCCIHDDISTQITMDTNKIIQSNIEQQSNPDNDDNLHCDEINNPDGCRNVNIYKRIQKLGEGTYGVVYKAVNTITNQIVALKKIKLTPAESTVSGFPITALREVNILLSLHHPHIIPVREMVLEPIHPFSAYLVMDYMPLDMFKVIFIKQKTLLLQSEVKLLLYQLLDGCAYMHSKWIIHRDLKLSNLLYHDGNLYICDFGLARLYSDPLQAYTQEVVSLGYRAPELLLNTSPPSFLNTGTNTKRESVLYNDKLDIWSVGCIFFEMLTGKRFLDLKEGDHEFEALCKIFRRIGLPPDTYLNYKNSIYYSQITNKIQYKNTLYDDISCTFIRDPYLTSNGMNLLLSLLEPDPSKRISAEEALHHPYFTELPKMAVPKDMPSYDDTITLNNDINKSNNTTLQVDSFISQINQFQK